MDKYADYSQIEHVTDLNTSNEAAAGPSRSMDAVLFGEAAASTSNTGRTASSEGQPHHYESFPLFRLQHHSEAPLQDRDPREWQYTSPERVSATRADIDDNMLAEFAGYVYPPAIFNRPGGSGVAAATQSQWVANLLVACARAAAMSDSGRVKNLMWVLNEISSPYGDSDQRLSACFLQALFCRITGTGVSCHRILTAAAEKTYSFDSLRKMILDYQVRTSALTNSIHAISISDLLKKRHCDHCHEEQSNISDRFKFLGVPFYKLVYCVRVFLSFNLSDTIEKRWKITFKLKLGSNVRMF